MSALQLGISDVVITNECGTSDIDFDLQYNHVNNCDQTGLLFSCGQPGRQWMIVENLDTGIKFQD